jgi:hypothetical protein
VIAEAYGCGFVTPVVPTLAPLRTLVRLALALRPVLLGAVLARHMLAWPVLTRCMLTRLMVLGAGFGVREPKELKPSCNVAPNGQSAPPHRSRYPLPSANRWAMNSFIVFIWSGEKVFFPRKPGRFIL